MIKILTIMGDVIFIVLSGTELIKTAKSIRKERRTQTT